MAMQDKIRLEAIYKKIIELHSNRIIIHRIFLPYGFLDIFGYGEGCIPPRHNSSNDLILFGIPTSFYYSKEIVFLCKNQTINESTYYYMEDPVCVEQNKKLQLNNVYHRRTKNLEELLGEKEQYLKKVWNYGHPCLQNSGLMLERSI